MKKIIAGLCLALAVVFALNGYSSAASKIAEAPKIKAFVSGKQVKLAGTPITVNGQILLEAKDLLVKLGVPNDSKHIQLNISKKSLVINSGNLQIKMTVDNTKVTVGKASKTLNSSPVIYKNKFYIPVKSTAELLNMKFAWDEEQKSLYIQKVSDYNRVKAVLDKAISATKAAGKYIVEHSHDSTSNYKDDPSFSKDTSLVKVDKKKMIMTIEGRFEDSYFDHGTSEYYLYNNYLYSKYSFNEKWEKEQLSKKDYEEWILDYDVSKFKISDILYCGLSVQEDKKKNAINLTGNVYLHVNKAGYEFEPVKTYLEISINKANNLIGKIIHTYDEYQDSTYFGRYLYSSKETFEYKDYNGDFIVEIPDESKMEFEENGSAENGTPISLSDDEEAMIEELSSKVVKVPVDGAWDNPYDLDITQASMFIVIKSQSDFAAYSGLSDDAKKVFINQIVQDNYGDYLGCETVYGRVVYSGKEYTAVTTGYDTPSQNVTMEKFENGSPVTVIVQDKKSNSYSEYKN